MGDIGHPDPVRRIRSEVAVEYVRKQASRISAVPRLAAVVYACTQSLDSKIFQPLVDATRCDAEQLLRTGSWVDSAV